MRHWRADPIIAYTDPANYGTAQHWSGNLGMDFTVNEGWEIEVTALGIFNPFGNGEVTTPMSVALYDVDTAALVSPVVTFGVGDYTPEGDGYDIFQDISPTELGPGDYEVVACCFGPDYTNGNVNLGSPGPTVNTGGGALTFVNIGHYDSNSSLDFPLDTSASIVPNQFDAGTFEFIPSQTEGAVPEPGTLLLVGSGLLAVSRRLKRKQAH